MNIHFLKAIPKVQANAVIGKTNPGLAAILLISILLFCIAEPLLACCGHDPCPPCHYWNGSRCVYQCCSCETCVTGEMGLELCIGTTCPPCHTCNCSIGCVDKCGDPGETCCTDDPNKPRGYCCGYNKTCCKGNCCGACKTCVDGECLFCGGDPDKICCSDGSCALPCENTSTTGQCDTSQNENYKCIGCTLFPYDCSDFTTRIYTGYETLWCTGGCPGDCVQLDAVHCYSEYECMGGSTLFMHACGIAPDPNLILCGGDIEGEGEEVVCVSLPLDCLPWWCTSCVKNPITGVVEYVYPKACQ